MAPSGTSPAVIFWKSSSDSAVGRFRKGLSVPGAVSVPRALRISSADCSSTYARSLLMSSTAKSCICLK